MQALSGMRRNITDSELISRAATLVAIFCYEAISTIYLYMPPLLGIMFLLFIESNEKNNIILRVTVLVYLILFESDRGFLMLSAVTFFILSYAVVVDVVKKYISCQKCLHMIFIFYAYFGYWLFLLLLSFVFDTTIHPEISYIILYYAIIETILAVILL